MNKYFTEPLPKTEHIDRLVEELYRKMPEVEFSRDLLRAAKAAGLRTAMESMACASNSHL